MSKVDLHFPNASCAHCVRLVSRSLKRLDGVVSVDADGFSARLVVGFDPRSVSAESIREVVEESGYPISRQAA